MSHLSALSAILATKTSYTITSYPDVVKEGYNLIPITKINDIHPFIIVESFWMHILKDTLANLETAIAKFQDVDSHQGTGYAYSGTATDPIWIEVFLIDKTFGTNNFESIMKIEARWVK